MSHRREQSFATEASVERIRVKLADGCFGDGIGLRVPPRRADELRQQPLVEVRISVLVDLVEHLLEDRKGILNPIREPERAAQLERDLAAPRRVGEELEACPQVVGCGRGVRPPLPRAALAPGAARTRTPPRRGSPAAGPFVRRSAEPSSTSTSARVAGSVCSSSARVRYSTAASAAPWESERSAAWRSGQTTNESALGAIWRRWPAALSGGAPASSSTTAAKRCAAA